jgi:replicative DNA helicase
VHAHIFRAIRTAQNDGQNFDALAAEQFATNNDLFYDVGGKDYVYRLVNLSEAPINAEERAHMIMDLAAKRDIITIGENLQTAGYTSDGAHSETIIAKRLFWMTNAALALIFVAKSHQNREIHRSLRLSKSPASFLELSCRRGFFRRESRSREDARAYS